MHICTFDTETVASKETLWQLWTQPKHWPTWDIELESAELSGAFKQGATGTFKYKDGSTRAFTIIKCVMLESYVLSVQYSKGVELTITRDLHQQGDKVHFKQEWNLNGPPLTMLFQRSKKDLLYQQGLKQMEIVLKMLNNEYSPFKEGAGSGAKSSAL